MNNQVMKMSSSIPSYLMLESLTITLLLVICCFGTSSPTTTSSSEYEIPTKSSYNITKQQEKLDSKCGLKESIRAVRIHGCIKFSIKIMTCQGHCSSIALSYTDDLHDSLGRMLERGHSNSGVDLTDRDQERSGKIGIHQTTKKPYIIGTNELQEDMYDDFEHTTQAPLSRRSNPKLLVSLLDIPLSLVDYQGSRLPKKMMNIKQIDEQQPVTEMSWQQSNGTTELGNNGSGPFRDVVSIGQCCTMNRTKWLKVRVLCIKGWKDLQFLTAKSCACGSCIRQN